MSHKSGVAFADTVNYKAALASEPDVVVILLGMNDSKDGNWDPKMFKEDYKKILKSFEALPTHPKLFICMPTPLYGDVHTMHKNIVNGPIQKIMKEIKNEMHIPDS